MIITNNHNLPEPVYNVIAKDFHQKADYSVTELLNPVKMNMLKKKHWNELTQDASDMIWLLLGKSIHYILEKGASKNSLTEEYMTVKLLDRTLSGSSDLYEANGTLSDYKITSVYSFTSGVKKEWEYQLNIYRWLFETMGFKVNKMQIIALLRDWSKNKKDKGDDYPESNVITRDIPFVEGIQDFVIERLVENIKAEEGDYPDCTYEQMWERPTIYAAKKDGRTKALKLFTEYEPAEKLALEKKGYVETRPGCRVRCENYCLVKNFCEQYKKYKEVKE